MTPIRQVVIAGGGTAGWMAAAVLSRAFGGRLSVRLVESEDIGTVGVGEATIPQIRLLTGMLGLDEDEFLRRTHGTLKLGIEFAGWGSPASRYLHAFGTVGRPLGLLPFHHYWLRARQAQPALDLWRYSLNARAAALGRAGRQEQVPRGLAQGLVHAFHFDASLVAGVLSEYAQQRGVTRIEGQIREVRLSESGDLASLELADGRSIAGDFFLDCTGFRALLIGQALGVGYEDWTQWLPCDRAIAVPCSSPASPLPYTRAMARPAGWQWRIPLQHRLGNGHVFCSQFMGEDEATALLLANLDGEPLAAPRVLGFTTGRRREFWKRNCLALGLASGFMEPLESTSIHLVQSGLSRWLALYPGAGAGLPEAAEYNRQTAIEFERIRDFLILHYHANGRTEPFWQAMAGMAIPESLRDRLALFRASGRLFREGEELFTEMGWLQVMVGQGVIPAAWHPLADQLDAGQLAEFMTNVETLVERAAADLPSHESYLRERCAA
ncbi:MAG: tryptophan halogenase family protein [Steroidobacteraceae bacterium]